jgi:tetratricopeptide (TPR) repeat protein
MRNLAMAVGVGLGVFAALFFTHLLRLGEATVPAGLAIVLAYYLFARRTFKQVEAVFLSAAQALQSMPPKFELALSTLEKAYAFAPHQFGVRSQIDPQIGVMHFLRQDTNKALPYLKRSMGFGHWMSIAMLAVIYYKKKDHEEMKKALHVALKRAKGQALVWCLNAYLLMQIGERDQAQKLLAEGVKKTKDDARVKEALLAVQNDRKIKMRVFKEQWYQFQLERPPVEYQQAALSMRVGKVARRGRWA